MSILQIIIFCCLALVSQWVLIGYWTKHVKPKSPTRAILGIVVLVAIACFPLVLLVGAVDSGQMPCLGRGCARVTYSAAASPVAYWFNFVALFLISMFFISIAISAACALVSRRRKLS